MLLFDTGPKSVRAKTFANRMKGTRTKNVSMKNSRRELQRWMSLGQQTEGRGVIDTHDFNRFPIVLYILHTRV